MKDRIRVAVNGFGRIGRYFTRMALLNDNIELVAVNDLANVDTLAHLLKYDSVHGVLPQTIESGQGVVTVGGREIRFFSEKDPEALPWKDLDIDVVIESTGLFRNYELVNKHIKAGAKRVILSSPPDDSDINTFVLGINDHDISARDIILSNASCTTNSAAPLVKIMQELAQIESCYVTTVHSYTSDQKLHDAPHKDLRRARAASHSIVPTTTGAAKALNKIFPDIEHIGGCGIRVPVINGSLSDMTFNLNKVLKVEDINNAFKSAAENQLKGILQYTEDHIVSVDIIGNPHSCIFDADLTSVVGKMVKVVGWYDNEAGYSNRLLDMVLKLRNFI